MSLRLLFETKNKATLILLCDVLNVTAAGGKVDRWVVLGRDFPDFDRSHFADAYTFLQWARKNQKMTITELIDAIQNYASGPLLTSLRALAEVHDVAVAASDPPLPRPLLEKNENPAGICVICLVTASTTALSPCGHKCLCSDCAQPYKNGTQSCPMCRRLATQTIQVFDV
jgi:hypothetical protein